SRTVCPCVLILCTYGCLLPATPTTEFYTLSLHDALPISGAVPAHGGRHADPGGAHPGGGRVRRGPGRRRRRLRRGALRTRAAPGDRKSTRLNSSHVKNSYAVFCLKKKNINL